MPKTLRQIAHLERLNKMPSVQATRFQKGFVPATFQGRATVPCDTCGAAITRNVAKLRQRNRHYCSTSCLAESRPNPETQRVYDLYLEGKKYREISEITNKAMGTVAGLIYRAALTKKFGRTGKGRTAIRTLLPKECELCGFSRIVEMAHIVPQKSGGKWEPQNIIALCPNCHHLFDHKQLDEDELDYLMMAFLFRVEDLGNAEC